MPDVDARVANLIRQQAAIASFGGFSLREADLEKILTEAARSCAETLRVPYSKVCRYRNEYDDLLVEAGHGWHAGVVGHATSSADESTPQGRAFITGEPAICRDLRTDTEFKLPAFYAEHGIRSTIDVLIKGNQQPYGVLEIDNDSPCDFDPHDIDFLTSFANVLAEAVETAARAAVQTETIERMKELVSEKDQLLKQTNILADELQHRVRNNLQLISSMLSAQLKNTVDENSKRGIKGISRRLSALSEVYENLSGKDMAPKLEFCGYLRSLCQSLSESHADDSVSLTCVCDPFILELDKVTALGIIVAEVVANSYEHAFHGVEGATVEVEMRSAPGGDSAAVLSIRDNGVGFDPASANRRQGVGLVRRLAEQLGGNATVEIRQGTAWTIAFPVAGALIAH